MRILKFGGTSVGSASAIQATCEIVRTRLDQSPVVVVSALAGVTTELLALAEQAAGGDAKEALERVEGLRTRHLAEVQPLQREGRIESADHAAVADYWDCYGDDIIREVSRHCDGLARFVEAISVLGHVTPRSLDAIAAVGELLSLTLVSASYKAAGLPAVAVDARRVLITDGTFARAEPLRDEIDRAAALHLQPIIAAGRVPVMAGFVGATQSGVTTTLGRGGSDFTAALLGAALRADAIEIWTDVDGMLTADPRIVSDAQLIETIRFDEASELATFGAKVLHPRTIAPAVALGIPVFICNTRRPNGPGTRIAFDAPRRSLVAIAGKSPATMLKIRSPSMLLAPGFLRRVYEVFERHRISVDVVATSEVSISLTIDSVGGYHPGETLAALLVDLRALGDVSCDADRGVIALVGAGLADDPKVMAQALEALGGTRLDMLSLSATGLNLTVVVDAKEFIPVTRRLHAAFFTEAQPGKPLGERSRSNGPLGATV